MSNRSIPDYLSTLAHPELVRVWSPRFNVILERQLWVAVMETQRNLGLDIITEDEIRRSTERMWYVNLPRIEDRERKTRHDLKARLEEFAAVSEHEHIHLGMTSADVVENVYLMRIKQSLLLIANFRARPNLKEMAERLPLRGIKGPVGTEQDMIDLLGSAELSFNLDTEVAKALGFQNIVNSSAQVMYRSIDLEVASAVVNAVSGIRHPLQAVLAGFVAMITGYQGDTWNEGDVSSSVVRRVALPGLFFAADALLESQWGTMGE